VLRGRFNVGAGFASKVKKRGKDPWTLQHLPTRALGRRLACSRQSLHNFTIGVWSWSPTSVGHAVVRSIYIDIFDGRSCFIGLQVSKQKLFRNRNVCSKASKKSQDEHRGKHQLQCKHIQTSGVYATTCVLVFLAVGTSASASAVASKSRFSFTPLSSASASANAFSSSAVIPGKSGFSCSLWRLW
jgi:hypothetical protein